MSHDEDVAVDNKQIDHHHHACACVHDDDDSIHGQDIDDLDLTEKRRRILSADLGSRGRSSIIHGGPFQPQTGRTGHRLLCYVEVYTTTTVSIPTRGIHTRRAGWGYKANTRRGEYIQQEELEHSQEAGEFTDHHAEDGKNINKFGVHVRLFVVCFLNAQNA